MNFRIKSRRRPVASSPGFRDARPSGKVKIFGVIFGLLFFAAGAFFCWIGAIQPILASLESRSWDEVACTIVTSQVESVSGSDGDTFRVAITFSYQHDGHDYTGGSYGFGNISSSGYKGKAEIVQRYPVGKETTCWVNPNDPNIAVLSRGVPGMVFLIIPFTSIFMLVGLGFIAGSLGLFPKRWAAFSSRHKRVVQDDRGEAELKPSGGPLGKLLGAAFAAVFWNGIVSVFVAIAVAGFRKGDPEWGLVLFLIPFVVIGLGLIGGVAYFALALTNPKIHLSLNEGNPRLGQTVRLRWRLEGAVRRLKRLTIAVEGVEAATYRVGTRSTTDRCLFSRIIVLETDDPAFQTHGEADFTVPENLMHSFDGGNNKIGWSIRVKGDIPRWPNVSDSYPMVVRPRQNRDA